MKLGQETSTTSAPASTRCCTASSKRVCTPAWKPSPVSSRTMPMRMPVTSARRAASTTGGTGASIEVESIGSCPAMTSCSRAASSTVRVHGPAWSSERRERHEAVARDPAVGRLGADRAGDGRRLADRATGVGADRERRLERRDDRLTTRRRTRRGSARGPTGCGSGRRRCARWRSPSRTRPCWSCRGSASRPRAAGSPGSRRTAAPSPAGSATRTSSAGPGSP